MADETVTPSDQYVKDFNNGYLLAKEMPEIAATLAKAIGKSERSGFQDGRKQFTLETVKDKMPDFLKSDRIDKMTDRGNPAKDKGIEKDSPDKD